MTGTIEIIISPAGTTKLETKGFTGPSCRDASRFLEEALGCRSTETLTAKFFQVHSDRETNTHLL
jgi:hypothetical protein